MPKDTNILVLPYAFSFVNIAQIKFKGNLFNAFRNSNVLVTQKSTVCLRTHFSKVVLQKKSSREDKYLQIELLLLKN